MHRVSDDGGYPSEVGSEYIIYIIKYTPDENNPKQPTKSVYISLKA